MDNDKYEMYYKKGQMYEGIGCFFILAGIALILLVLSVA